MATAKKKGKEVAEASRGGALANFGDMPEHLKGGSGRGNENVTTSDLTIPRLVLLQQLSPQLDEDSPEFTPGAKAGMFLNTVTKDLYDSVTIVDVSYRKEWVVFRLRKHGGGFISTHPTEKEAVEAVNALDSPSQYEVVETGVHFCLQLSNGDDQEILGEVVLAMTSTKLKHSRNLNSMIRMRGGDRWAGCNIVTSQKESNDKGQFHNINIKPGPWVQKHVAVQAEKVYDAVQAGQRTYNRDEPADVPAGEENSEI